MRRISIALAAASGLLVAVPATAQQKVPVQFAKGASSTTVKGTIKGDQFRDYQVNALAGQALSVMLANPDGRAFFNVLPPGSTGEALFVGSTSGSSFRGPVTANGITTVRVYQMRATARRGETAAYTLAISVSGVPTRASADAKVAGTKYNATADISCVVTPGGRAGACKAGVVRHGQGKATVEMQTPDGGQRTITFSGGRPTGSNAGMPLRSTRNGDITTVWIGATEVYYIPDAFVFGG